MRGYKQLNGALLLFYWFVQLFLLMLVDWAADPSAGLNWYIIFNISSVLCLIPALLIGAMATLLNVRASSIGYIVMMILGAVMAIFPLGILFGAFNGISGTLIACATGAVATIPFALLWLPKPDVSAA